ncbi:MAG: hypothetical protein MUF54_08895 [Polyangiaceae bacterium]|jgi:hypothetical protein|nr:hypothetical protein [Polyangiaceae bacterium]
MVLWVSEHGPLGNAASPVLQQAEGAFEWVAPEHGDLFGRALHHRAIVYQPAACLLDGLLAPRPDPERSRVVTRASRAPGVELIVMVLPRTDAFVAEEDVLRREGKPYVILRSPVLFEEVAEHLPQDSDQPIWLPRTGQVTATSARAVASAVLDALGTDDQGRVLHVPGETVDVAELFVRASADRAGSNVHAVWPLLYRVARPVVRALLGREPKALGLADQLMRAAR